MSRAVEANEPDTINYRFYLNESETECIVWETYANSEAVLVHINDKKSIEYYRRSLQINPEYVSALVNLAGATVSRDLVQSMKLVSKALKIEPHHEIALKNKEIIQSELKKRKKIKGKIVSS
jgi:hypothetical protein